MIGRPAEPRVVLWGGHPDRTVQFGSFEDRATEYIRALRAAFARL